MLRHKQRHSSSVPWDKIARPERVDALLKQAHLVNPQPPISAGAIEARTNLEKLKGEAMPDLNTALRTALENGKRNALSRTLDAWEKDEKATQLEKPMETGKKDIGEEALAMTRVIFNYVRDNPNCTMTDAKKAFPDYNGTSVGSLFTQFVIQRQFARDSGGRYWTIVPEYIPLMSRAKWDKINGIVRDIRPKGKHKNRGRNHKAGIAALHNAQAAAPSVPKQKKEEITSILISRNWTAQGVVDKLTVMQARQLYDLLKQVFGG